MKKVFISSAGESAGESGNICCRPGGHERPPGVDCHPCSVIAPAVISKTTSRSVEITVHSLLQRILTAQHNSGLPFLAGPRRVCYG
jgi:hypothetical protein